MGRKLFFLIFLIFLISVVTISLFQSCNEYLTSSLDSYDSDDEEQKISGTGISDPNFFAGINNGFPKKCSSVDESLELWSDAGNSIEGQYVGYIEFYESETSDKILVRFNFINPGNPPGIVPWAVKNIHFHIGDLLSDIPVNEKGNPVLENFRYNYSFSPEFTGSYYEFECTLPPDANNDGYYVSACASMCLYGGLEGFNFYLPDERIEFNISSNHPYSRFNVQFLNNAGFLSNNNIPIYECWNVNPENNILSSINSSGYVFSVYEKLPSDLIGTDAINLPDNLDLINWILNNFSPGMQINQYNYLVPLTSAHWQYSLNYFVPLLTGGTITCEDIQAAIYAVINDSPVCESWNKLDNLNQRNAWGIIYKTLTSRNADGFLPDFNNKFIALLVPVNEYSPVWNETMIVTVPSEIFKNIIPFSTSCKIAWADGKSGAAFPKASQQGTYVRWNITYPAP